MKAVINNSLLHYIDIGIPNAVPVVFIHGFPFSHKMWTVPGGQTEAIAGTNRIVAFDVRGHGESEVGTGHFLLDFFVDDLIGLLNHLTIQKAIVVGLSMGGYIALRAIDRYPERILGLMLCDTRAEGDTNEAKANRAETIVGIRTNGIKAFAEEFTKKIFDPESFKEKPDAVKLIQSIIERTSPLSLYGTLTALAARTDSTPVLPNIQCPVLIVVGENDRITPPAAAQAMKEKIPHSELQLIPKAAHMSNLENPELFNRHLRTFVAKFNSPPSV